MALPRWLAKANRRFINPGTIRRGSWPVLIHVGRKSGRTYRTPLDVYESSDGRLLFTINYGTKSDWPRNVLAAGRAQLERDGQTIQLDDPRVLPVSDAYSLMTQDAKRPPAFVGVKECLVATPVRVGANH